MAACALSPADCTGDDVPLELESRFSAAADRVACAVAAEGSRGKNPSIVLNPEAKLQLYGLYKQAVEGPCCISRPPFWDVKGRAKWAAWNQHGALSTDNAMDAYVEVVRKLLPQEPVPKEATAAAGSREGKELSAEGGEHVSSTGEGGSMGGAVFSSFADESSDILDGCLAQSRVHEAAASGDAAAVRELVGSGAADVNARDEDGCCPLHWAADRGHLQVVSTLLELGADIDVRDSEGQTPLHYAALCEERGVAEALLAAGSDARLLSESGETAQQLGPSDWSFWGS